MYRPGFGTVSSYQQHESYYIQSFNNNTQQRPASRLAYSYQHLVQQNFLTEIFVNNDASAIYINHQTNNSVLSFMQLSSAPAHPFHPMQNVQTQHPHPMQINAPVTGGFITRNNDERGMGLDISGLRGMGRAIGQRGMEFNVGQREMRGGISRASTNNGLFNNPAVTDSVYYMDFLEDSSASHRQMNIDEDARSGAASSTSGGKKSDTFNAPPSPSPRKEGTSSAAARTLKLMNMRIHGESSHERHFSDNENLMNEENESETPSKENRVNELKKFYENQ